MAVEVTMPRFGLTMHEGTIQRFFKAVGDNVRAGEPLYEVETEKVLYEVEAPVSGTLAVSLFEEGATVECGRLVAVIAEPGDDPAALAARYGRAEAEVAQASACDVTHRLKPVPPLSTSSHPIEPSEHPGEKRRPASPVARKLAAELGVDLAEISGTGPGGRITREDVE
ncbi:MAG: E3 binding domain-containing protein, partial [Candidatus Binataceae bacterium]